MENLQKAIEIRWELDETNSTCENVRPMLVQLFHASALLREQLRVCAQYHVITGYDEIQDAFIFYTRTKREEFEFLKQGK